MRSVAILATLAAVSLSTPTIVGAATPCPPEVKEARDLLTVKTATVNKATPPGKPLAAARGQDPQAARGQDPQTARGQDPQTARGQDPQTARNVIKGRAAALANARRLVIEAEAACKDADARRASANARAGMELLRYLP
jgi:hypothetical protein